MFERGTTTDIGRVRGVRRFLIQSCLALSLSWSTVSQGETITVPNGSFESPTTFFVSTIFDSWQRTPQPEWWNENATGPWTNLFGIFKNAAPGSNDYIDNCDDNQAAWLFANPDAGLFQDYESVDWNDPAPTHAFAARFEPGKAYRLTVGLIVGTNAGPPMLEGVTLDLSLYYLEQATNRIVVATTVVTNSRSVFSNPNHFLDHEVNVPTVKADDPWAGKYIGIRFLSTVSQELAGGYWDLDNVRLTSILAPALSDPVHTNNQFQFTLQSEPGTVVEILAATNAALAISNWSSLLTVTNVTGTIPLVDTNANFNQRFYQARQWP